MAAGLRRLTCALAALALLAPATALAAHTLVISEYVEGTSNNKGLEIYNPTGAPVNLSGYSIQIYFNGSGTPGSTIALPAVALAAGDVFWVAHNLASFAGSADLATSSLNFNGDDAVVLLNGMTPLDIIGQIGFDPGTEWGTGLESTADNTLRRDAKACEGDTNGADAFDPAPDWTGFATDTFGDLGSHTGACTPVPGASAWALVVLAGALTSGAAIVIGRRAVPREI